MKKLICLVLTLCMICGTFVFTANASSGGVNQNPQAELPFGDLDISSGVINEDEYCAALDFNDNTVGYFWSFNQLTANAKLYFRASENGLYFAADIHEDTVGGNTYVPSTGYDNIDNNGASHTYGFNGDVMTLMLDPLGLLERTPFQNTAWYNVAVYTDGSVHMYRSRVNEADITNEVTLSGGLKDDESGWYFQSFIPWSIIINDVETLYPDSGLTVNAITSGAVTRAACMYMDRYKTSGVTNTWGRYITVCEATYDGYYGTSTSGPVAKAFGLKLNIDSTSRHTWGKWEIEKAATCTEDGKENRTCSDCGKTESRTVPAVGHSWSNWVTVTEPTETENGLKRRSCANCGSVDERILAYTEQDPQVVVYYNASVGTASYEFANVDVVNYHPAQVTQAAGYPNNPIRTSVLSNLDYFRSKARAQNPDIKVCLAVANESLSYFESWLKTDTYRKQFASYFAELVEKYELDGIDIDYEFPTSTDLRDDFVAFIAELRTMLDEISYESGRQLTISLAVPAGQWAFSLFDIEGLAQYVDWFNIMSYDLYCGANYPLTHHHTPAYDNTAYPGGSVASDIALYTSHGITKDKIVVGAGMYARKWEGVESTTDGLFAKGVLDESNIHYSDIRSSYVNKNGFVRYWDNDAKAPYLFNKETKTFISYDDEESVAAKCDLILANGVRGIMVFDYVTCDGCGFFDQLENFLDSTTGNHIWGTWELIKNSTCTEKGQKMRKCSCGEIEYADIDALGHDLEVEWIKIPTTTESGSYRYACKRCGAEIEAVSTELSVDSYWSISSSGESFSNVDGDIVVKATSAKKINPFAKALSKYTSELDGFYATVTPSADTDSLCLFWTTAHDWYDEENEWSVPSIGSGAGNYRYGNIRNSQAAKEYTYSIVLCDYLDLGWFVFPGTPDDGKFDVVISHTVSKGNFWGSSSFTNRKIDIGIPLTVEMFNHYDEDEGGHILGFIINGEWFYDTSCASAFEQNNDGFHFGVLAYTEGSGNINAAFSIDSIGDDDTTIDFMGYPFVEHTHSFGEWYTVVKASCLYAGVEKRTCTCGVCEKVFRDKVDHEFGEWKTVIEPTSSEEGTRERTCSVCGTVESETIPAVDRTPEISTKRHNVFVTNADTLDYIRYAQGEYTDLSGLKQASDLVQLNERKINDHISDGTFTRYIEKAGTYTFWLRAKDGTTYLETAVIADPEAPLATVNVDGLRVTVAGLEDAKAIRMAYGEYNTVHDIKNCEYGYRSFAARDLADGNITFCQTNAGPFGIYTLCISYADGYNEIYRVIIEKKTPSYTLDGNLLTLAGLEGMILVRTAAGEYTTGSEVKAAEGSRAFKPSVIKDGKLKIVLWEGINTIFVQFDDNSCENIVIKSQ